MDNNVNSTSFLLTAIINGEDAVSLDISPSSIVWNQEGDVSVDSQGNTDDNSSWPKKYITASVRRGDADESGWLYGYTVGSGCSFDVRKGTLGTDGTFTVDTNGHTFELSNPRKTTDANGKQAESLWTNGTLRITATKEGSKKTKDADIILNALATWKQSVVNGTMTAVSQKTEAQVDGKMKTMQSQIQQSVDSINLRVSTMTSGRNMWINGDFEMNPSMAPAYVHNTDGKTAVSNRIDAVDLPAGFAKRLVFNCPAASYGIYYKTQKNISPSTLNSSNAYCLSFFAKTTKACEMNAGLEGIATGTVALTSQWKRYAIYIPKGTDYTKWNGTIIFYPTSAIGADQYVCITGIQMETGGEADGAPSVWAKSTDDIKQTTGIDITNGTIDLIAGLCNFVGKDGNPYIKVAQDEKGYPHLIFMDPELNIEAYDLGWTGLNQIVESSERLSFPFFAGGDFFAQTLGSPATINVWDLAYQYYMTYRLEMYQFHPASFVNMAGTRIYVPAEAGNLKNKLYSSNIVNDGLPLGQIIADGWYLQVCGYGSASRGRAVGYTADGIKIVNIAKDEPNYVSYDAILVVGNKYIYHAFFTVKTWAVHGSVLDPQITNNDGIGLIFEVKDGDDEKNALNFDTSSETLTLNNVS